MCKLVSAKGGVLECVYAKNGGLVQWVHEILRSLGQSSISQCSYEEKICKILMFVAVDKQGSDMGFIEQNQSAPWHK